MLKCVVKVVGVEEAKEEGVRAHTVGLNVLGQGISGFVTHPN